MESHSKLDYVMKALDISGDSLAKTLMVDKTLVSKWRNQRRKLGYDSPYINKVAEHLIISEAEQKRGVIHNILKSYRPDIAFTSKEQKIEAFSLWLSEETIEMQQKEEGKQKRIYTPKYGYNTNVSIFLGDKGVFEGVAYYMKYLLTLPPGEIMYMIDYSGINWNYGDEGRDKQMRIHAYMELFRPVLEYGHKFIIVDCDTDIHRPYRAIFRWMELYLTDGVEVWVHPRLHEEQYYSTSFLVKDEIALQCISAEGSPNSLQGLMYHNNETINFLTNSAKKVYHRSKKLIETIGVSETVRMMDRVEEYIKARNRIYMLNPSLTLQIIEEDLLLKILRDNLVGEEAVEECLEIHRRFKQLKKQCSYISIYNLDYLEEMSSQALICDNNLSVLCDRKIFISKENWRSMLRTMIQLQELKESQSYLVLTSFRYLSYIPDHLSIMVQDDCMVAAWNVTKYKKRLYCVNPNVIAGFYRYLEDIWYMIPSVCKEVKWRNKQLLRMLEHGKREDISRDVLT